MIDALDNSPDNGSPLDGSTNPQNFGGYSDAGVPHKGWHLDERYSLASREEDGDYDNYSHGEPDDTQFCEMCHKKEIVNCFVISHPEHRELGQRTVGEICASNLCENYTSPNAKTRLDRWVERRWVTTAPSQICRTLYRYYVEILNPSENFFNIVLKHRDVVIGSLVGLASERDAKVEALKVIDHHRAEVKAVREQEKADRKARRAAAKAEKEALRVERKKEREKRKEDVEDDRYLEFEFPMQDPDEGDLRQHQCALDEGALIITSVLSLDQLTGDWQYQIPRQRYDGAGDPHRLPYLRTDRGATHD